MPCGVNDQRVTAIPLRGSEAYLTNSEGVGNGGEQGAVAVAVWAAQDGVLFETTHRVVSIPLCGTEAYPSNTRASSSGQR